MSFLYGDGLLGSMIQTAPATAPGKPWTVVTAADGTRVAVVSLLGRVFMRPVDCPWTAIDRVDGRTLMRA